MSTKVITIAQQKGGAGKTTISAHLAVAFAQKNKKVAIIDIDPQASLSTWARLRTEKLGDNNDVLSIATNSFSLNSEIKKLQGKADIIIVDSPPHIQSEARHAIRYANLVILPVQPSPTDLWATKATLEICKQENVTAKILLNRVAASSNLGKTIRSVFEATAPEYLLKGQLGNRVGLPSAMLDGLTVSEVQKSGASAKEIEEIISEISNLIGMKIASETKAIAKKKKPAAKKKAATKKKATAKKKPSAKKAKPAAKNSEAKKAAPKKKKAATKKPSAKKPVAAKAATKKAASKKVSKKAATKKASAKKSATITKLPVQKKEAKKPVAKKAKAKKASKAKAKKTSAA